jgi:acyl-CoA synthetase (AMP-forming)/AMP-acid ligase II
VVVAGDDAAAGFVRVLKAEARRVLGYPERPDEIWDASQVSPRDWFYNRAQAAVRSLLPRLRFSDGEEGGLTIEVASPEREQVLIGSAGDLAWFTRLSSGERSLVDEAMLDAAAALRSDMLDLGATVGIDVITSGGVNIYPAQIENVLLEHPAVADCCVVGVPDDEWGEHVHALVQPITGAHPDPAAIVAHCRKRLAGFQVPRNVELVDELPRTDAGKLARRTVRNRYWSDRARRI